MTLRAAAQIARNGQIVASPFASLEVHLLVDLPLQSLFIVAREPADDSMHFLFRATLLHRLSDVVRVDTGEGHSEYSRIVYGLVAPQILALSFKREPEPIMATLTSMDGKPTAVSLA